MKQVCDIRELCWTRRAAEGAGVFDRTRAEAEQNKPARRRRHYKVDADLYMQDVTSAVINHFNRCHGYHATPPRNSLANGHANTVEFDIREPCLSVMLFMDFVCLWAWLVKWILSVPSVRKVVGSTPPLAAT